MGDRIGFQLPVRSYQPPRSTQPGHPSVGRCNDYRPKGGWCSVAGERRQIWLYFGGK